jgi:hypothetical protein
VNRPGRNSRSEVLAPFGVRSFRFQFPADLVTSWTGEMEILILTLGVGTPAPSGMMARLSFWRGLREGLSYVWDTPASLAAMWLAFLVNMTALPLTLG